MKGGETYLSNHRMNVRETRYWVEGFVAAKSGKFTEKKRRMRRYK
jgi:hypothetical protein